MHRIFELELTESGTAGKCDFSFSHDVHVILSYLHFLSASTTLQRLETKTRTNRNKLKNYNTSDRLQNLYIIYICTKKNIIDN